LRRVAQIHRPSGHISPDQPDRCSSANSMNDVAPTGSIDEIIDNGLMAHGLRSA
jgi:hypothetical protein